MLRRSAHAGEKQRGNRLVSRYREGLDRAACKHPSFNRRCVPGETGVEMGTKPIQEERMRRPVRKAVTVALRCR